MRKQYLVFLIIILLFAGPGFAGKVKSFTGLNKPDGIAVDDQLVVVTEGTTVYLYSAKDFSLVKKFGKRGEGPQEFVPIFNVTMRVQLLPGYILVGSMGKISFFKRNGEYIK
ncbi:MAG: hypothetical protein GY950_37740, partial [bacterium]|nr:hypothetical protein [bacterium]